MRKTESLYSGFVGEDASPLDLVYICAYNMTILYQWDPKKAESNLKRHGVDFADAVLVFEDEAALTIADDSPDEERYITVGMDALSRVLVVVYTWRGNIIRVISARKATGRERKQYEG